MSDEEENENIVKRKGRKAYDKSVPRLALEGYVNRQPEPGYVSWQSKINTGPEGTIDEDVLNDYLAESDFDEIKPSDIENVPSGSRIAYITKTNKWRSAGWYSRVDQSSTDVDGNRYSRPKKYLVYRSYNNACFSIRLEDVVMFYVKRKKPDVTIKRMVYFKKPTTMTNFPVTLLNEDGVEVTVHYAKDNYARNTWKKTNKYRKAVADPLGWLFDDDTQYNEFDDYDDE